MPFLTPRFANPLEGRKAQLVNLNFAGHDPNSELTAAGADETYGPATVGREKPFSIARHPNQA